MMRTESKIKFVGLHAHSGMSLNDGLGYPQEHMDYAYENGMEALALTDHGHCSGLSYQVLHAKKMQAEGKNFKPIFGVEAYFLSSIEEWKVEYNSVAEKKKNKKKNRNDDIKLSIEDESASKKAIKNILNRRNHLILVAMSQKGLNNIFKLVSESYKNENFYRYPRIDYDLLARYSEGVMSTSACLGGVYAGDYWNNKDGGEEQTLSAMRKTTERMLEIFGDRWYGELQWNAIPEQHELNKYIIQVCKECDVQLVSTADSHYPNPNAWTDRELYKRLGWLSRGGLPDYMDDNLPVSVEDIGYELYPKNGDQMWESYKKYSELLSVEYDDDLVMDSIQRTHEIAHERIENFLPDNTVRLPNFVVPEGMTEVAALTSACIKGLKEKNLQESQEYIDRLKEELYVIKDRGFSKYFLTMKAIADKAVSVQLVGPGRGSAAGSLVAYVLNITQIDPIKYGLLFSRFLSKPTHYSGIVVPTDADGEGLKSIKAKLIEIYTDGGELIKVSPDISLRVKRNGATSLIPAGKLEEGDELIVNS